MDLISGVFTLMEYSVLYLEIGFNFIHKIFKEMVTNVNSGRTGVWNSMQNVIY